MKKRGRNVCMRVCVDLFGKHMIKNFVCAREIDKSTVNWVMIRLLMNDFKNLVSTCVMMLD